MHSRRRQKQLRGGEQKFARIFFRLPKYHGFNFQVSLKKCKNLISFF